MNFMELRVRGKDSVLKKINVELLMNWQGLFWDAYISEAVGYSELLMIEILSKKAAIIIEV